MSAHFKLSEFSSPRTDRSGRDSVPPRYQPNVRRLMTALETIRKAAGDRPMSVISGWRSVVYNRANKGRASRSQHLYGKAADLRCRHMTPARLYWVIKDLQDAGTIPKGGLACYGSFVHYDIRGRNARWRAEPRRPGRA
jgi:uncharacterized protein YcbK (DUF882 family)